MRRMELVAVSLVAICALAVCASAVVMLGRMHAETLALLRETLTTSTSNLSRLHASLGMTMTDAASKTAAAIGDAVSRTVNPPAPATASRDEAYAAARDLVAGDSYRTVDVDDAAEDPTDRWISPEREDLAVIGAAERTPTGIPGFAFDLPLETIDYSQIGRAT